MSERTVNEPNLLQGWLYESGELGVKRKSNLTPSLKEFTTQLERQGWESSSWEK